jgi:hypothetical protein
VGLDDPPSPEVLVNGADLKPRSIRRRQRRTH